ncbi:hypothetical protein FJZ36_05030 [Candidatus Poribacteria bacterium]|nr:hypothetical protein [Candidatus Poribacteria bacterium]
MPVVLLQERRVCQDWSWIENTWSIIRDGKRSDYDLGHRLYSAKELKDLALDCGFAEAEAYGHLSGTPYDHTARRQVIVARKKF